MSADELVLAKPTDSLGPLTAEDFSLKGFWFRHRWGSWGESNTQWGSK